MSMSKFMILLAASQAFAVKAQDCQCFANGYWNEPVCEGGDRPTIDLCLQDDKCHWGPDEFTKCQREVEEYHDIECQCFANGAENEIFCEGGMRPNIASCLYDDKCHWGPAENPKCRKEAEDQYFHFENCKCLAHKAWIEPFCEDSHQPVHEICLQDDRCQWEPPREYREDWYISNLNEEKCQCFANTQWNEVNCEGGERPTIDSCLGDFICHWGPTEINQCQRQFKEHIGGQNDFMTQTLMDVLPMNPMFQQIIIFASLILSPVFSLFEIVPLYSMDEVLEMILYEISDVVVIKEIIENDDTQMQQPQTILGDQIE